MSTVYLRYWHIFRKRRQKKGGITFRGKIKPLVIYAIILQQNYCTVDRGFVTPPNL